MKKLKKILKIIAVVLIILSTSIIFYNDRDKSNADAGYHSSYSGGSHSSSSSSSRRSSSSSSSRSSRSSSSSGSSSGASALSAIIFIIIIIIIISTSKSKRKQVPAGTGVGAIVNNQQAIDEIKKYIPDFNVNEFLSNGYNIYLRVEDAWMNFELDKVSDCITDEMFNMYQSQLTSMELKGEQNIMKGFRLLNSAITSASKQNSSLEVKTKYVIEFYDYIINKETKQVLRGNSNRKIRMVYEFTFIKDIEKTKLDKCPNCGAPVEMASSGTCEYCNSKLVDDSTQWVMSKKLSLFQG